MSLLFCQSPEPTRAAIPGRLRRRRRLHQLCISPESRRQRTSPSMQFARHSGAPRITFPGRQQRTGQRAPAYHTAECRPRVMPSRCAQPGGAHRMRQFPLDPCSRSALTDMLGFDDALHAFAVVGDELDRRSPAEPANATRTRLEHYVHDCHGRRSTNTSPRFLTNLTQVHRLSPHVRGLARSAGTQRHRQELPRSRRRRERRCETAEDRGCPGHRTASAAQPVSGFSRRTSCSISANINRLDTSPGAVPSASATPPVPASPAARRTRRAHSHNPSRDRQNVHSVTACIRISRHPRCPPIG